MEKYTHTFRFGSVSLREKRMAHQTPTPETQADSLVTEAETLVEHPEASTDTRLEQIQKRLGELVSTAPAVAPRLITVTNLRTRLQADIKALQDLEGANRTELAALRTLRDAAVTALPANLNDATHAWITDGANGAEIKMNRQYSRIRDLIDLAPGARPLNFSLVIRERMNAIRNIRALAPANPALILDTTVLLGDVNAGGGDLAAVQLLRNKILNGDPAQPPNSPARIGLLAAVTEYNTKKTSTDPLIQIRVTELRAFIDEKKNVTIPQLVGFIRELTVDAGHDDLDRKIDIHVSTIRDMQTALRVALGPTAALTSSTTSSTGPTSTPEGAFNALPTGMRPFAEQLRNGIVAGTDTGPAIAGLNAQLASIGDGARPGIVELLNTYLRNTPKMVRLTGAVLSVVDRTATSTGAPGTYPPAGPGVMGALPPLPPGMEQPANAFFNQARPLLGLLQSIGFLPPSFTVALNAMNGREVATLQTELTARNQQLAERRARLGTLAPGSAERTQVEGEIRALEFRVQQLTQQIATLRTATTTGSPEMQALMRQLMTQFLRMQRQGGQMGMMPMMRPGGGGFDLYGMNQLGNSAMGYGYGRVGPMGGAIGYYPQGYGPNVFTGPVSVMGGAPMMGPPMMGPMMGPGPMPFPPRPPMMGGGMVMGGGFFTAPKPSGNDSRPV